MTEELARPNRYRPARVALAAGGASILVTAALMAPAGAGQPLPDPTASADVSCRNDEGYIHVSIVDDFSTTYDVVIGGIVVDPAITDTDGGVNTYGPYADGDYLVEVEWLDEEVNILEETVTIDCIPDGTTTTAAPTTTTAPPEQVAPTTTAAPAPIAVQPTYTG